MSNGYYKFENLPKGEYYVQVKIPNEKYELTEKQVGTNNEINSKFNEEEKETDKIEGLNSIDLPELTGIICKCWICKDRRKYRDNKSR